MADYPITVKPVSVWEETKIFKTLINEALFGNEQRKQKWENPKRKFVLRYIYEDMATIWDFARSKNGSANSFTFDPYEFLPNDYASENINVRFESDEIGRQINLYGFYGMEVVLIEVR